MPGPLSVLIIEDDEVQSEYLAEWIIRKLQIVVDTVTTGESALESISQNGNQYDAVLVDQVLPGIDGIETIRRLKIILPGVHIIMLTGGDEDVGLEALQLGAYRYILKPINPKEIEFLLRHIAEIRQLEQQLAQQNVSLRESETRRKDLENLVRASEAVTQKTASGPRSVLEEVARSARNLTGADFVVIYPYDPARKHFFDTDSVVADGLQEPRTLGQKPREMGLASIVRNTKEIVVQNVATGEFDPIGHDSLARLRTRHETSVSAFKLGQAWNL